MHQNGEGPQQQESRCNGNPNKQTFRGDGCEVGVVETGVGVGVESFAELFDLFEYDMSGIAAGARTFQKRHIMRSAVEPCVM